MRTDDFEDDKKMVLRPFNRTASARIGRSARMLQFRPEFKPAAKIKQMLHPVKVSLGLWVLSIYAIPSACESIYICQTARMMINRLADHARNRAFPHGHFFTCR